MSWTKLHKIYGVVGFARDFYPNFNRVPKELIEKIFRTYKDTTLVYKDKEKIRGFVVYQEWPDCLNFIMICLPFYKEKDNMRIMLRGRHLVPNKKIVWFDEEKMEGRGLCHLC